MEKLKEYIDNENLSKTQFAYESKITLNTLRRVLEGKPCYRSTVTRIMEYLAKKKITSIKYSDFNIAKK